MMPPSGYNAHAVDSIVNYFQSCFSDLNREIATSGIDWSSALNREIRTISKAIESKEFSDIVVEVMLLIQVFYKKMLEIIDKGIDPNKASEIVIKESRDELLNLKI